MSFPGPSSPQRLPGLSLVPVPLPLPKAQSHPAPLPHLQPPHRAGPAGSLGTGVPPPHPASPTGTVGGWPCPGFGLSVLPPHVASLILFLPRILGGGLGFWDLREGRRGHGAHGRVGALGLRCRRGPTQPVPGAAGAAGPVLGVGSAPSCPPLTLRSLSPGPWGVEAPGEAAAAAVRALSARLLGLAADLARDPDPSVYLALRLASDHSLRGEERYLARLQDAFQRRYGRSLQAAGRPHAAPHGHPQRDAAATEHSTYVHAEVERPETGRLALYLLGLRATCPLPEPGAQRSLVTWLKYYLEEDWAGSRRHGHPLSSYYQYSLGVLALCVHRKRVREEVIRRLLAAEQHGRFGHAGGSATDTEAVAALAFACLERERLVGARLAAELRAATRGVRRRMVEAQGQDGFFGNVYSTPWAMQVFIATNTCRMQPAYGRAMAALLENLDAFTIAATMAQVLPVLHGRSYLDIASMRCQEEPDTLTPIGPEPPPEMPGNMMVRLVVDCPQLRCPRRRLYDQPVHALAGASLLDVLSAAAAQESHNFTFDTQDTSQGPFLSRVLGLEARQQKRSYWQLLTAPGTSLQMGVADYRPRDGETLILRLSEW
ncbi:transcobalamin-2 isoform X1 [Mycteria americana]|uniref:transcobalamin-2 isoform X1 n=1 Tax=Mycteria americana TaxID=33587 RepID=UPI003F585782